MQLERYDEASGRRVRLTEDERDDLLRTYTDNHDPQRYIGLGLMAFCGLRSQEAVRVTPSDIRDSDDVDRTFLHVEDRKASRERRIPMPEDFVGEIREYVRNQNIGYNESILGVTPRTLRRWVKRSAMAQSQKNNDLDWQYVGPHDLRRTWGHLLLKAHVPEFQVMDWGGWGDWETFNKHYAGKHDDRDQDDRADKANWL